MEEEPKIELTAEEFETKMFLQAEVMKYTMQKSGISEEGWMKKYSNNFSQLSENSDISERFEKTQDKNPEELYAWIQGSLEAMGV